MTEPIEAPAFTIPGVPQSITREQYLALISAVGLDVRKCRTLEFRTDGIYAEVLDRDENNATRIDRTRDEAIIHRVYIPVV